MTPLFYISLALFLFVCAFMVLLVLIQKGRGGGLSGAFGGAGGNTAFGSKTGDVLTWATSIVFGVFLLLAVTTNLLANHKYETIATTAAPEAKGAATRMPTPLPAAPALPTSAPSSHP